MKRCLKNGSLLAFSIGLIVSRIVPQCWLVVVMAVILALTAIASSRCCKF